MAENFRCTIVTPEYQAFDGEVKYASIPAWDGQIGLMHQRAPLLVKLGDGPLRLDLASGGSQWFFVGGGFAQMKDNKLSVVTGEATQAQEIAGRDAEAALKEAQARVARTDEEVGRRGREVTRARSLMNLAARAKG